MITCRKPYVPSYLEISPKIDAAALRSESYPQDISLDTSKMLGSFTALITISLSTAAINSFKNAIRKTSVQLEERSDAPSVKFCSQPCLSKDPFCGGGSSDGQYCTLEKDITLFNSGCKGAFRTSDPDPKAGGITAILTQGVFCTFYPNKNCNDDVRDRSMQYFQIPQLDENGNWVNTTIHDLRCLEREGTRHGIYTDTGDCTAFLPFEKSWDNKVQSYRCIVRLEK